eukprot:6204569-Pleurochrysis_carterae.AAC.1
MAASGAASLAAQYSPPIASKATAADTTSNYWSTTNGASTAAHYKGATLGQVQYEINKAGLQLAPTAAAPFVPASERQPIKAPNGSMRPRDEHAPTMTRMLGLTTFSPQTNPSNANTTPAYGAAFDRLMTSLRAADAKGSGSGKLLPTDIFRMWPSKLKSHQIERGVCDVHGPNREAASGQLGLQCMHDLESSKGA